MLLRGFVEITCKSLREGKHFEKNRILSALQTLSRLQTRAPRAVSKIKGHLIISKKYFMSFTQV